MSSKKNKYSILIVLLLLIVCPKHVFAFDASLNCSSQGSVNVGDTITVTFSGSVSGKQGTVYWLSNTQSALNYSSSNLRYLSNEYSIESTGDFLSKTYTFEGIQEGTATVSLNGIIASDGVGEVTKSSSCTINVSSRSSGGSNSKGKQQTRQNINRPENSDLSEDNSLKSLSIENVKLSPEFNSDTLTYDASLLSDEKTNIKITAEANDKKAKIDGNGEKEVDTGLNKFEVNVTAENGSVRTYILNVTVSDKNPIIIKIDGKKYKLVRKIDGIEAPEGYEKTTIKIKGKDVDAYRSKVTGYTLVALMDSDNKTSLFIYDKGKYTRYSEFTNSSIRLILLKPKNSEVPYKYKKCTFTVDNKTVDGFELSKNSKFKLVYALNLDTNEKAFYLYDLDEKTFQRFYNEQVLIYIGLVKKFKMGLVVIGGIFLIMFVSIICLVTANKKTAKNIQKITNANKRTKTMIDE